MQSSTLDIVYIVLADDDRDDCLLFRDALEEFTTPTHLTTLGNGEELMTYLYKAEFLPNILFLDLNMPRKNGFECLTEIKQNLELRRIPVIMFSTSYEPKLWNWHIIKELRTTSVNQTIIQSWSGWFTSLLQLQRNR